MQAVTKLDEIEIQLESTDLPRNSAALAERHAYLSHCIVEAVTPAIHEGRTLLERVGRDDPGAAGVNTTVRASPMLTNKEDCLDFNLPLETNT